MKIGCNTLIYGGWDLAIALQHIAWSGYDGIELAAIKGMAEHAQLGQGSGYARRLRRQIEDSGLEVFHIGIHPQLSESEGQERVRMGMELASEMEVPLVLLAAMGYPPTAEGLEKLCETLSGLAVRARTLGLKLAVKPHVDTAVFNTASSLAMIHKVGEPNVGLDFDVSHIYRANESPADSFCALSAHVLTVRVRDAHSRDPQIGPPETQVPGRGVIDIEGILLAMKKSGYCGDISLDIVGAGEYSPDRAMALIAETRGYLRCALRGISWV